jgi:hypothetical protein
MLGELRSWTVVAFGVSIALAMSPNLIHVFGIHTDYEALINKSHGFFHSEADQLITVARPVAALFSNIPLIWLHVPEDWHWSRLFSLLSMVAVGTQLMSICVNRLRTSNLDAVAVALVTFLCLPFIYSILQPSAWAPHLLGTAFAFSAYSVLARSNVQALSFMGTIARKDVPTLCRQLLAYGRLKPVLTACAIYQLSLYDYPPNALILAIMPTIVVLFSGIPRPYRYIIAARDGAFVGTSLVIYSLTAKLLFMPVVHLFIQRNSDEWRQSSLNAFESRVASSYEFAFSADLHAILIRLGRILKVSGDLWFVPQWRMHLLWLLMICVAIQASTALHWWRSSGAGAEVASEPPRLAVGGGGVFTLTALVLSFVLAASPIVAAGGGFVTYRTVPATCAIAAVIFLFCVQATGASLASFLGELLGSWTRRVLVVATTFVAVAGNFYANEMTMTLARNELVYTKTLAQQIIDSKAERVLLIDPRPFTLPEDNPEIVDQQGRPVPPYELGCLSSYCLTSSAILTIALEELGRPRGAVPIFVNRGESPIPSVTCDLVAPGVTKYPPSASRQTMDILDYLRRSSAVKCINYDLRWHDLGLKADGGRARVPG